MRVDCINALVGTACPPGSYPEQWDIAGLKARVRDVLGIDAPLEAWMDEEAIEPETFEQRLVEAAEAKAAQRVAEAGEAGWRQIEKSIMCRPTSSIFTISATAP